jgi:hypothetical protein
LPDFEKGQPLRALIEENGGFLHPGFSKLPPSWLDRPLHKHQDQALTLGCQERRSPTSRSRSKRAWSSLSDNLSDELLGE